jgi:hypothetical protein
MPARPVNNARFVFLDPRAEAFYGDWERVAGECVAILRWAAGRDPHDRVWVPRTRFGGYRLIRRRCSASYSRIEQNSFLGVSAYVCFTRARGYHITPNLAKGKPVRV